MPETIDIRERSTPEWAAIVALATISDEVMGEAFVNKGPTITVELKINGVEVSFATIINRLKEEAVKWSFDKARDILEDRASVLDETLNRLKYLAESVEQEIKREVHKLLPEAMRPEDYD